MKPFFYKTRMKMREFALKHADSKAGRYWLGALSFSESIFFPFPMDAYLMALLGAQEKPRWVWYSVITIFWSVVGGIVGYFIGLFLFESVGVAIIEFYGVQAEVEYARGLFEQNAFWAVFIAGFTFVPYKIFTISAGFFEISFATFLAASIISRALRFFIVGYFMKLFGSHIARFAFRYFNIVTAVMVVAVVIYILMK